MKQVFNKTTLDVGIDVDGILYNFDQMLALWIHIDTGRALETMPPATTYRFWRDDWGLTQDEFFYHYTNGVAAKFVYGEGHPYMGAAEGLQQIAKRGHRIHIITARELPEIPNENVYRMTHSWLDRYGIPFDTINLAADKTTISPIDIFLEDYVFHYNALDEVGHRPFLLDRPWNRKYLDVRRVYSYRDFVQEVDNMVDLIQDGEVSPLPKTVRIFEEGKKE